MQSPAKVTGRSLLTLRSPSTPHSPGPLSHPILMASQRVTALGLPPTPPLLCVGGQVGWVGQPVSSPPLPAGAKGSVRAPPGADMGNCGTPREQACGRNKPLYLWVTWLVRRKPKYSTNTRISEFSKAVRYKINCKNIVVLNIYQ